MIQSFLTSMIGYCLLALPIYLVIRAIIVRNKRWSMRRELVMLLFYCYSISIFSQTIVPRFYIMDGKLMVDFMSGVRSGNLVPLQTIRMYIQELQGPLASIAFYNLAGNIILFIPFGIFLPWLWRKLRSFSVMWKLALGIPLCIEGIQYFIGRRADIDDVILNAVAIVFGYFVFMMTQQFMKIMRNK